MVDQDMPDSAALWQEIEQGLRCAMQSHFADATAHFLKVRAHVSHAQTRFAVIIDAFLSSHSRYWAAQQALHSASQSFVVAYAEQLARLDELRQLLAEAPHQLVLPAQQVDARGYTLQPPTDRSAAPVLPDLPALRITCFGRFSVQRQGMAALSESQQSGDPALPGGPGPALRAHGGLDGAVLARRRAGSGAPQAARSSQQLAADVERAKFASERHRLSRI